MQYRDDGYPARGDGQLPRAPGLVARRRGDLLARAVRRMVRPRAPGQSRRRSSTGEAALAERRSYIKRGRRRAPGAAGRPSCAQPRGIDGATRAPAARCCGAAQGPLRNHGRRWPTAAMLFYRDAAARRRRCWRSTSPTRCGRRSHRLPSAARERASGRKAAIAAAIKETLARARPEDAAAGDAGARAGDGHGADAVDRRGAGAVRPRDTCWRACERVVTRAGLRARFAELQ